MIDSEDIINTIATTIDALASIQDPTGCPVTALKETIAALEEGLTDARDLALQQIGELQSAVSDLRSCFSES